MLVLSLSKLTGHMKSLHRDAQLVDSGTFTTLFLPSDQKAEPEQNTLGLDVHNAKNAERYRLIRREIAPTLVGVVVLFPNPLIWNSWTLLYAGDRVPGMRHLRRQTSDAGFCRSSSGLLAKIFWLCTKYSE